MLIKHPYLFYVFLMQPGTSNLTLLLAESFSVPGDAAERKKYAVFFLANMRLQLVSIHITLFTPVFG